MAERFRGAPLAHKAFNSLAIAALASAGCQTRERIDPVSPPPPMKDTIDSKIFGQDQVFFSNWLGSLGLEVTGATGVLPISSELESKYKALQIVAVETRDQQPFTYILIEDQNENVTQNFVVWLADDPDSLQVTAYKLEHDTKTNIFRLQEVDGKRVEMGTGKINPATGELAQATLVLPDGKAVQADQSWLDQLFGVRVAAAAELPAATPTPEPSLTWTPMPTPLPLELTPTPTEVPLPQEFLAQIPADKQYEITNGQILIDDRVWFEVNDKGEWRKSDWKLIQDAPPPPLERYWGGSGTEQSWNDMIFRSVFPIFTGEYRTIEINLDRRGPVNIDIIGVVVPDPNDSEIIRHFWAPIFIHDPEITPITLGGGILLEQNQPNFNLLYVGVEGGYVSLDEFKRELVAGDQLELLYYQTIPSRPNPWRGNCQPDRQCDWLIDLSATQNQTDLLAAMDAGEIVDWPAQFVLASADIALYKFKQ